jgi:nucleoside-diphosphate kinase
MIERTLVLLKPDAVQRNLMGRIIQRFEDAGLKFVAMKMINPSKDLALKHYTEDISIRRGEKVRNQLIDFVTNGPVLAFVLEGVNAIENVRKMVGATEPKAALPGTIRGDFAHVSYSYSDARSLVVKNLVHASSSKEDAENEIKVWFKDSEIYSYKSVHDVHILD